MLAKITNTPIRILDFDIENRPLTYNGPDYTTAEVTAIACSWTDQKKVHCWLLGEVSPEEMLSSFLEFYNEADMVTGHYIRKHDLPIINGALIEYKLPTLTGKLSSDTCIDLLKRKDLSRSQESLAGMYGLPHPKHHMSQTEWRLANRLTPEGIEQTKKRVVDDVIQHKSLRECLIENDVLGPPRTWKP